MAVTDTFFLRDQYRTLAIAGLLAMLLSAVAATLLARQILAPLRALESGAKALASGNYTARIAAPAPGRRVDELGRLIEHYNALAASLEAARLAERQWISDTSHELQTPLAILRAQVEALQDGVRAPSETMLGEMLATVLRLSRLVADIRTLAFAAEAKSFLRLRNADLSAATRHAVDAQRARLAAKGLSLRVDLAPEVTLRFDPDRIDQVIGNLLENALRYTSAPGTVEVTLRRERDLARLIVADCAPAPEEAAIPRLFDRFYRVDSARDRASGGSGLGLSICKTIVEAHGGTISAGLSPLGGLAMTINLPMPGAKP